MKTSVKIAICSAFTLSYALLLSLGSECLLNLMGAVMSFSLDGKAITELYPRFIPFCICTGVICAAGLIGLAILNFAQYDKIGYTKQIILTQTVCSIALSIPMVKIWEWLFDLLHTAL